MEDFCSTRFQGNLIKEGARTLVSQLKQCGRARDLERGKLLHSYALAAGYHISPHLSSVLISMYSKCGSLLLARVVFDGLALRDVVSWTALITGYVENGHSSAALDLFSIMDCSPNSFTFSVALKACMGLARQKLDREACLLKGLSIHSYAKELGFDSSVIVASTLMTMYSAFGDMESACSVFKEMQHQDVVSWNVILMGYVENGESVKALELFDNMTCGKNHVTLVAALKACAILASSSHLDKASCLRKGRALHQQARELNLDKVLVVSNSLLDMYRKLGRMRDAREVFNGMVHRDAASWTIMMLGYVENEQSLSALKLFNSMDCAPDRLALVAALKSCGCLGALETGRSIHDQVRKLGWEQDETLANCLVDFYSKCGDMQAAEEAFSRIKSPDAHSWNALIGGFGSLGNSSKVLFLVKRMEDSGVKLDDVTALMVLTAYNHAGMVEEGKRYFDSLHKFGIKPSIKHYTCMVDILGKCNRLGDAVDIIRGMECAPNSVIWITLLGACRRWGNVEIGKVVFNEVVSLNEDKRSVAVAYVWLRNIYEKLSIAV